MVLSLLRTVPLLICLHLSPHLSGPGGRRYGDDRDEGGEKARQEQEKVSGETGSGEMTQINSSKMSVYKSSGPLP